MVLLSVKATMIRRLFASLTPPQLPLVISNNQIKLLSTSQVHCKRFGPSNFGQELPPKRKNFKESLLPPEWHKLIDKYPDFLPDPINNTPLLVSKMIDDMLERRTVIDIPEFYVGSILSVTVSDKFSETKRSKFLGICIHRSGQLTNANFTIRNVIDGMGCEIRYDLYNPLLLSVEVLKLEKRLDDNLTYLRDALPEYSTFPEDMKPVPLPEDGEVPLNKLKVKMKKQPWTKRWERWLFKGIESLDDIPLIYAERTWAMENDPVYNYDLMLEYRRHCTEEQMYMICKRLQEHEEKVVKPRLEAKAKRFLRVKKE